MKGQTCFSGSYLTSSQTRPWLLADLQIVAALIVKKESRFQMQQKSNYWSEKNSV